VLIPGSQRGERPQASRASLLWDVEPQGRVLGDKVGDDGLHLLEVVDGVEFVRDDLLERGCAQVVLLGGVVLLVPTNEQLPPRVGV